VNLRALCVFVVKKDMRKIAVQNTVPEIGSLASRGWQVGHEVESRAMPGPVHAEVAAIQGEHDFDFEPLGHRHDGGIDHPEPGGAVLFQYLDCTHEVLHGEVFEQQLLIGERAEKPYLRSGAQVSEQQVAHLRHNRAGNDQRFPRSRDIFRHGLMVLIVLISQRVQGTGISQDRHLPALSAIGIATQDGFRIPGDGPASAFSDAREGGGPARALLGHIGFDCFANYCRRGRAV